MSQARLTVSRTSPDDARERQVVVSLDGRKMATLLFGGTITRDIEPGPHRLRAHNTLVWKTLDFEIAPGDEARFTVVNRPGRGTTGLLSILGARPLYLELTRDP
jgi:hypothetical protein